LQPLHHQRGAAFRADLFWYDKLVYPISNMAGVAQGHSKKFSPL
jgi:hypothetical protein